MITLRAELNSIIDALSDGRSAIAADMLKCTVGYYFPDAGGDDCRHQNIEIGEK